MSEQSKKLADLLAHNIQAMAENNGPVTPADVLRIARDVFGSVNATELDVPCVMATLGHAVDLC